MRNNLENKRNKEIPSFEQALIDGYASLSNWDKADEKILPHMLIARELMAVSWLNSRSDNPRLRKRLKPIARRVARQIKLEYSS